MTAKNLVSQVAPKVYKEPMRVTPRGFVALMITIIVAIVFFAAIGREIPDYFREFVALLMGYLGARTLKQ